MVGILDVNEEISKNSRMYEPALYTFRGEFKMATRKKQGCTLKKLPAVTFDRLFASWMHDRGVPGIAGNTSRAKLTWRVKHDQRRLLGLDKRVKRVFGEEVHKAGLVAPLRLGGRGRAFLGVRHEPDEVFGFSAAFVLEIFLAVVEIPQRGVTGGANKNNSPREKRK